MFTEAFSCLCLDVRDECGSSSWDRFASGGPSRERHSRGGKVQLTRCYTILQLTRCYTILRLLLLLLFFHHCGCCCQWCCCCSVVVVGGGGGWLTADGSGCCCWADSTGIDVVVCWLEHWQYKWNTQTVCCWLWPTLYTQVLLFLW